MAKRGTISSIILGGISLISISLLIYYWFFRPQPTLPLIKDIAKQPTPAKHAETKVETVVEDVEDDSDEEEEEEEEVETKQTPLEPPKAESKAKNEEIKEQYDAAVRLGQKYVKANDYNKAVEKLTEAIKLSPQVSASSKDLLALYNNRSAMKEKLGKYDDSLRDILVVLTMDCNHSKARLRRARIYEAQVGGVNWCVN
jgi:tetratricopeptide (TPR) repeat protein